MRYVRKVVCDRKDDVFTARGAVTQNSSERVGSVCLLYRQKGVHMSGVHYAASTDCGLLHVNGTVIATFATLLARAGIDDDAVDAYGSWQERLHERLGLPTTEMQRSMWHEDSMRRARRGLWRRTADYKRKRAGQRKRQKQQRNAARRSASTEYTYKEAEDDSTSNKGDKGTAGSCKCGVKAKCGNRACPCVVARVPCTPSCHGGRPSATCVRCESATVTAPEESDTSVTHECAESDPESDVASVYSLVADEAEYVCVREEQ